MSRFRLAPKRLSARLAAPLSALRDRRGVAALEFAMIAPVLFLMFFGIAELGQGLIAERRVSHATESLGDLVAQAPTIDSAGASDIFNAAADIMTPLPNAPLLLRVSSITGNAQGNPIVDWSFGSGLSAYTKNVAPPVTLPNGLIAAPGDTIILAQSQYQYTSPIGYVLPSGMAFTRSAYLRPRAGTVTCPSC